MKSEGSLRQSKGPNSDPEKSDQPDILLNEADSLAKPFSEGNNPNACTCKPCGSSVGHVAINVIRFMDEIYAKHQFAGMKPDK